jgi:ATP-dependent Lon protease
MIDRHFSLGSHLNARDVKAVRKTVSGMVKLIYPHGEMSSEDLGELVEIALEGRRRVKEQLKKMGSFEYHQTSFLLHRQGHPRGAVCRGARTGRPGHDRHRPLGSWLRLHRLGGRPGEGWPVPLEVGCSPGTGKLKIAGGVEGTMKESIKRAFAYLNGHKVALGIGQQVDTTDFHVEAIDLLSNRVPCECGIALVVAVYSAIKKTSVLPGLLILGDSAFKATSSRCVRSPSRFRSAWTTALVGH